ncbi:hypothetical protein GN958_ATG16765 [Phytophthora infestans]|uniref:Uncharacterized protein n=1 Tax=Phytophthora infestans TaxID=4787 RepID=A0A8S9U1B5_PHYIN|nr:hypothetical protein GN958_ATG16765 [Phytophthora infestans]
MPRFARRDAMPHHHVPEAKETSPIVDRLRLQLNRTVRRTVTEAVDAVWAAFEDELTQVATLPPITPAVDDYEVFYDCCSRLAKFIESNMDTTPGFLEQMDRLILACHSGVMGRSVLTKDLRIRRGSKMRNETEHANTKTGQLRARKPVIPPPSGSRGMMDEASDEELKVTATVGTESRQWATRKRLSTKNHSPPTLPPSKRVKRSMTSEFGRGKDGSNEGMTQQEADKETKKRRSVRPLSMRAVAVRRTPRRMTSLRQLVNGFEDGEDNDSKAKKSRGHGAAAGSTRQESLTVKTGRKTRRSFKNFVKRTSGVRESIKRDAGYQTRSKLREKAQLSEKTDTTESEQDTHGIEENDPDTGIVSEPSERGTAPNGKQARDESPSKCDNDVVTKVNGVADNEEELESKTNPRVLEHASKVTAVKNCDFKGQKTRRNKVDCSGQEQTSDALRSVDNAKNCEAEVASAEVSTTRNMHGDYARFNTDDHNTGNVLDKSYEDQVTDALAGRADTPEQENDTLSMGDTELPIPGLCDAGMRALEQVRHFKSCLRMSIQQVDAFHCKPPPGKRCVRNCMKTISRRCSEGVPCRDHLCRNWHNTQAHRERCKNLLCEFKTRIQLRETMNKSATLTIELQLLMLQWEEKSLKLSTATSNSSMTNSSKEKYTVRVLNHDIGKLELVIDDVKENIATLKNERRVLTSILSAIGIESQNDAADGFPDFETHYK